MSRKTSLEKQYQNYLEKYYEGLNKYNIDFMRPLTKAEYKNARESYISDKIQSGEKVYPSNINRDIVTSQKDYAMTPAQARAYKKALEEEGIKVKYKTLRENKAIKERLDEEIKAFYDKRIEEEKEEAKRTDKKTIDTKKIALEVGSYFYGSS